MLCVCLCALICCRVATKSQRSRIMRRFHIGRIVKILSSGHLRNKSWRFGNCPVHRRPFSFADFLMSYQRCAKLCKSDSISERPTLTTTKSRGSNRKQWFVRTHPLTHPPTHRPTHPPTHPPTYPGFATNPSPTHKTKSFCEEYRVLSRIFLC